MKKILPLLLIGFTIFTQKAVSQNFAFHLNGNTTFIANNDLKGQYPILWYSPDDDRGILVGGFGVGVSYHHLWKEKNLLKVQLNAQRSRFYDTPTIFLDENGNPLGAFIGINTNLNASLFGMPVFSIAENKKWQVGAGLGLRGTFYSKTDYGETFVNGKKTIVRLLKCRKLIK